MQKWGNSLALRVPKSFADEVGLAQDSPVELSLRKGKLIVAPAAKRGMTLKQLLSKVTEDNLHAEVGTGPEVGREIR
jgi:antitoxin MazE